MRKGFLVAAGTLLLFAGSALVSGSAADRGNKGFPYANKKLAGKVVTASVRDKVPPKAWPPNQLFAPLGHYYGYGDFATTAYTALPRALPDETQAVAKMYLQATWMYKDSCATGEGESHLVTSRQWLVFPKRVRGGKRWSFRDRPVGKIKWWRYKCLGENGEGTGLTEWGEWGWPKKPGKLVGFGWP